MQFFGFLKNSPERIFRLRDLKFFRQSFVDIIYIIYIISLYQTTFQYEEKKSIFFGAQKFSKSFWFPKSIFQFHFWKIRKCAKCGEMKEFLT